MTEPPRLINTWDQLQAARAAGFPKKHCLTIALMGWGSRSEYRITTVWSPFFQTDPKAHWQLRGAKTFEVTAAHGRAGARAARLAEEELAKAWVRETYGYTGEWARNAMRDLVPAQVQADFPLRRPQ